MSEQIYKDFFEEALNQIHAEYAAAGKENDFKFWFNLAYLGDSDGGITVSVASEFLWKQMEKNGSIQKIRQTIESLTGQTIGIAHVAAARTPHADSAPAGNGAPAPEHGTDGEHPQNDGAHGTRTDSPDSATKRGENDADGSARNDAAHGKPVPAYVKSLETLISRSEQADAAGAESARPGNSAAAPEKEGRARAIPQGGMTDGAPAPHAQIPRHPQLNEDFTFENFVPGDNSQYAYSASLAAARNPGDRNYNPIFLYGGAGLGKTHLMVSIGNYIYEHNPGARICYVSTESFMNEFTLALRDKTTQKFTGKYRKLDVFLLDDIQFLEGKDALQNELFYTFNEIYNKKGQLVFTCDRPISEVKGITDRLRTRFSSGQNIDLKIPDYETRRAILEKKLEIQGRTIPADVIDYIAKNVQTSVRELEGSLKRIIGYAELVKEDITLAIAQEQLRDIITTPAGGTVTVEAIQKAVAEHFGITLANIKGSKRDKKFSYPRQIAFYLCKQLTEYSLKNIGEEFGGKDHTTVIHGINKIEDLLKTDPSLDATVKFLEREIKAKK